jgi:lipopolysaccharide exporter
MHKNRSFTHDILTVASVPVISQILGLILTPIVTRLYAPEVFGLANIIGSMVMLFAVFSTMGYHGAIILPKNDKTSSNILLVCFTSLITVSVIVIFIVGAGKVFIASKLNAPELVNYLWFVPIFVFFHGMYQTLRYWKIRMRRFDNLATSRVSEIIVRKSYQIPAGLLGFGSFGSLIAADLAATIAKNIVLLKGVDIKISGINKKLLLKLWSVAKRYKKFPQFSVWAEFFSRMPSAIISFIIIRFFGQEMLGYYGLSLMVLSLPSTLISGSVSEAFAPRVAMAKHDNGHTELLEKIYARLVIVMIFPFIILGLFGNRLFPLVFGAEWMQAGIIAQILVFRIFFEIIFSPALSLVDIMEKQELHVFRSVSSSLIAIVALMLGAHYSNFYVAMWLLALFEGISILVLGGYMMRLINFPFILSLKKIAPFVLLAVFLGLSLFFINHYFPINTFLFLGLIGTSFLAYYSLLAYLDPVLLSALTQTFRPLIKYLFGPSKAT